MEAAVRLSAGTCNALDVLQRDGRVLVRKTYREKLKNYEERWPLSRRDAEAGAFRLLDRLIREKSHRCLAVPCLYPEFDRPDTLTMDYIDAPPLGTLLEAPGPPASDLPGGEPLRDLFRLLSELRKIAPEDLEGQDPSFLDALSRQDQILTCMLRNKHGGSVPTGAVRGGQTGPDCLGLGDLSLNNLLWDGSRLWLLDLECVHWGWPGYDEGQLLAMAQAQRGRRGQAWYRTLNQAFGENVRARGHAQGGRPEGSELAAAVRAWQASFLTYYTHR